MNILRDTIGVDEHLKKQSNKEIYKGLVKKMRIGRIIILVIILALNVTVITLIVYHLSGEIIKHLISIFDTIVLNYFEEFEPGQRRRIMIAHYLVFMRPVIDSIYLWIRFFIARWAVSHGRLANDVLILYRVKEKASDKHNHATSIIRSIADMVTIWSIIRFGYHFPMYFLIQKVISVIIVSLFLVDQLKPGVKKCTVRCRQN